MINIKSGFAIFKSGKRQMKGKYHVTFFFMLIYAALYIALTAAEIKLKTEIALPVLAQADAVKNSFALPDINNYTITVLSAIVMFVFFTPLRYGKYLWHIKNAADVKNSAAVIFRFFGKRFFKSVAVRVLKLLWQAFLIVFFSLPPFIFIFAIDIGVISLPLNKAIMLFILVILLSVIMLFAVSMLYWQVEYIYVMYPDMPIRKIFAESRHIMRNKRMALCGIFIRCIPLILSCVFIFPCLYVIPVINSCFAEFAYDSTL